LVGWLVGWLVGSYAWLVAWLSHARFYDSDHLEI